MDLTSMPLAVSDATILYFVGGGLTALALIVSAIGVKSPDFPKNPRTAIGVVAVFMFFVIGSAAYAVLSAREEQGERREHLAEAEKGGEHGEPSDGSEGEAPAEGPAGDEIKLGADPDGQLAYDTTKLSAKAGPVTIDLTNPAPVPHDVVIADGENVLGESDLVSDGGETTATADLESGQYTFYCSVPGHREAGMEGTLKVK